MAVSINIEKKMPGMVMKIGFDSSSRTLGILGAPESGKSLLFRCIAGLETPNSGRIQINGKLYYDSAKKVNLKIKDRRVGYLFSDYALFPNLTVEQNIACGYTGKRGQREQTIEEFVHQFQLENVVDIRPAALTEEQRLRTALARILIGRPHLILIDEPTKGREGVQKESLYLILKKYLTDWGGDYILASQDPDEIYRLCERIAVPGEGVTGSTERIFEQPITLGTAYLTGVQNFSKIEILDEYHVRAVDWGIALRTEQRVTEDCHYVGIRSWHIEATESTGQNCMPIRIDEMRMGVHFAEYEIRNAEFAEEQNGNHLLWKSAVASEIIRYVYFPPEKLMLLR